jgi:GntR family transcriptional regulator
MAIQVAAVIRRRLRQEFSNGGRLPGEHEMAAELGVSRGTVRQALAILQQEGVITRHQGSGTYANPTVLGIQARVDVAYEFGQLIEAAGFTSTIQTLEIRPDAAPVEVARRLNVEAGAPVVVVRKVFLADNQPAIYVREYLPTEFITDPYIQSDLERPMFQFLEQYCRATVAYVLSEIVPGLAAGEAAEHLWLEPGRSLLQFVEVFYSTRNEPMVLAHIYFRDPLIRFHALRKVSRLD